MTPPQNPSSPERESERAEAVKECPACGLHPYDFDVTEYAREVDRLAERLREAEGERDELRGLHRQMEELRDRGVWPISAVVARAERAEAQLGVERGLLAEDAAGRPFDELLDVAADLLNGYGDGPVADCLRIKADELRTLARLHPEPPAEQAREET